MIPSGYECFWNMSPTRRSPKGGEPASQATAWQPDQLPKGWAPTSSAMRIPSPVLWRVPRTWASSQPGPRYRVRHSGFASNPPDARTTDRVATSKKPSGPRQVTPRIAPRPSSRSPVAFVP